MVGISEGRFGQPRVHYASRSLPELPLGDFVACCNPLVLLGQVQEAPVQPFGFEGALVCRNCFKTVMDDHGVPIGEAEAG
jgi:hypothetical protein